jgi:hypothetical protein
LSFWSWEGFGSVNLKPILHLLKVYYYLEEREECVFPGIKLDRQGESRKCVWAVQGPECCVLHESELFRPERSLSIYLYFILVFGVLGFELRASSLLGRHSATWAILPTPYLDFKHKPRPSDPKWLDGDLQLGGSRTFPQLRYLAARLDAISSLWPS